MTARQLVDATPDDRNRTVDLLRVAALVMVVLGHWLKQGWFVDADAELHRAGLLGIATWTHPLTWVFQVIPVFFVVGGFANAHSWRSSRARGVGYGSWLAGRMERLTRPVLPLLLFWIVVTPVATAVGTGDRWLEVASVTSLVPTWFLAAYVVVMALTPPTVGLWDRWGGAAIALGAAGALAVDAVSIGLDHELVGVPNLLLVWGTLHLAGIAWADGWFAERRRAVALAATGLITALLLVGLGPYGVSMVGVDGYGINNTNPPRATVLFLGFFLTGTAIAFEGRLHRLVSGPRLWTAVVVLESRLMTVFLWHLTALGILAALAMRLGGLGLHQRPNTVEWWLLRPPWILVLLALTAVVTALLGRFEDPSWRRVPTGLSRTLPLVEVAVTCLGLAVLASEGMTRGALTWGVAVGTVVVLWFVDRAMLAPGGRTNVPAGHRAWSLHRTLPTTESGLP